MGVMDKIMAFIDGLLDGPCKHPYPIARLELVPGEEYVRYYWECDCGATWDD